MNEDDIAEHDPLQCTCFDCLHDAGYGLQQAVDILLQQHDDDEEREGAGGDDERDHVRLL